MEHEEFLRKEYFMQVRNLNDKINEQKKHIDSLRETLYSIGNYNCDERVQTSPVQDRFAAAFARIQEEEEKLKNMQEDCSLLKFQLLSNIHNIDCPKTSKQIAEMYFVDCLGKAEISKKLKYSESYVSRMINKCIKSSLN